MKSYGWSKSVLALLVAAAAAGAQAQETITLGLSLPLSGAGASYGKGVEWMCQRAAQEVNAAGGVKVQGKAHKLNCLAYDNKYTAAEGTKVARTLLDRDNAKYIFAMGTAPILALQSLSERQGAFLFNSSWGMSSKGPKFPLTYAVFNSPVELVPGVIRFIQKAHPQAKTVAMLNVNDATGKESESIARPMWEKAGYKIVANDFYERGTTEFQPIASRLAAFKADIIDLTTPPPAEAGQILKELHSLGAGGIKILDNGSSVGSVKVTAPDAALEGLYMGFAILFDSAGTSDYQRRTNNELSAFLGEPMSMVHVAGYDAVYALKAGMEKAQSIEPAAVAAALRTTRYKGFFGDIGYGGKEAYGSDIQPQIPVYITQVVNGKLVERARIDAR